MQLDVPCAFRLPGVVFRQSGSLVVAFNKSEKRSYCSQPMLFMWAPACSYADEFFQTRPGQNTHWKEVVYNIDDLIDYLEQTRDRRVRRIVNWIQQSWSDMKSELLQSKQFARSSSSSSGCQFRLSADSESSGQTLT